MQKQVPDEQQKQNILRMLLCGKKIQKVNGNAKSQPQSRQISRIKRSYIQANTYEKNKMQNAPNSARTFFRQAQKQNSATKLGTSGRMKLSQKSEPKKIDIRLADVIKCSQQEIKRRNQRITQTVQLQLLKQQESIQTKQIKISVIDFEKELIENKAEKIQKGQLEYSFSKEYNKRLKTQSQHQETLLTSEFTSEISDSSQLKHTQKRSIQLQSSSPSTLLTMKQNQLSDDPLDNLQILQKLITLRMKSEPPKQVKEFRLSSPKQNVPNLAQLKNKKLHKSLPSLGSISPVSDSKTAKVKPKIKIYLAIKPKNSSPRQKVKYQKQNQYLQMTNQKVIPFESKKYTQKMKKAQQQKKLLLQQNPKTKIVNQLKFRVKKHFQSLGSEETKYNRNQYSQQSNAKQNLLQQIQSRPQINQSFLDPFEEISSVFGEVQHSTIIESTQHFTHDLQNLLDLATDESMEWSIYQQKGEKQEQMIKEF